MLNSSFCFSVNFSNLEFTFFKIFKSFSIATHHRFNFQFFLFLLLFPFVDVHSETIHLFFPLINIPLLPKSGPSLTASPVAEIVTSEQRTIAEGRPETAPAPGAGPQIGWPETSPAPDILIPDERHQTKPPSRTPPCHCTGVLMSRVTPPCSTTSSPPETMRVTPGVLVMETRHKIFIGNERTNGARDH